MKTYKQLESERFIIIDNDFFTKSYQDRYSIESILILALIQKNLLVRGNYIFNLQYLYDCLDIKSNNSTQQKKVKDCIRQLQEDNMISCDVDISKVNNNQLIYVDVSIPDDNYTIIYDFELDAIINYKQDNIYNLFNLLVFLKYRIGVKGYCYWNQTDIAYSIGLKSRKVISRMVDVLSAELKLVLVDNVGTKKFADGSIKESNNMYAMNYEGSRELLDGKKEEYKQELIEDGIRITNNKTANEKRRLKGRINHLVGLYRKGFITDGELVELNKIEEEYYKMIKNDEDLLEKRIEEFVLFKPIKNEEVQGYFGQPNPMDRQALNIGRTAKSFDAEEIQVDIETGEILDDNFAEDFADAMSRDCRSLSELKENKVITTEDVKQEQSFKEVELQNIEKMLRYYKNNFDSLSKSDKEKAKTLVEEYKKLKLELQTA